MVTYHSTIFHGHKWPSVLSSSAANPGQALDCDWYIFQEAKAVEDVAQGLLDFTK